MTSTLSKTFFYKNEQIGGILICGINDGYSTADKKIESGINDRRYTPQKETFFSDSKCRPNPFKTSLIKWFELWKVPLATKEIDAGYFEKSIAQINWIRERSTQFTHNVKKSCIAESDNFYSALSYFKPKIIILAGVGMHDAMESKQLKEKTHSIIGERQPGTRWVNVETYKGIEGVRFKAFRSKVVPYERSTVIAMPHPSSRGLSNDYILDAAKRNNIKAVFDGFRT